MIIADDYEMFNAFRHLNVLRLIPLGAGHSRAPGKAGAVYKSVAIINIMERIFAAFGVLGWVELLAALIVAVGCGGELWILINKLTRQIQPMGKTAGRFWRTLFWVDSKFRPLLVRLKIKGRKLPEAKEQLLERVFVILVALGVAVEFICLPFSMIEIAKLNEEAGGARKLASDAIERAANTESNNLVLSIELEKIRHPSLITTEQRERFIEILSEVHNVSKTRVEVFTGANDRETERFAFQVRKVLDEAGYGQAPSNPNQTATNGLFVTSVLPHVDLPAFKWEGTSIIRMPIVNVLPMKEIPTKTNKTSTSAMLTSENPFTDNNPDVIAIFSETVPDRSILPSVMVVYPTENNHDCSFSYVYAQTGDPNAILYGICNALHAIGITVGKNTAKEIMPPGHIAFFIPSR